VDVLVEISGN